MEAYRWEGFNNGGVEAKKDYDREGTGGEEWERKGERPGSLAKGFEDNFVISYRSLSFD